MAREELRLVRGDPGEDDEVSCLDLISLQPFDDAGPGEDHRRRHVLGRFLPRFADDLGQFRIVPPASDVARRDAEPLPGDF